MVKKVDVAKGLQVNGLIAKKVQCYNRAVQCMLLKMESDHNRGKFHELFDHFKRMSCLQDPLPNEHRV